MHQKNKNIEEIKRKIKPILQNHNVKHATIVGSFARGEDNPESDLDIVIQLNEKISLLKFAKIKIELEEVLQRKIDLVEQSAIKPKIKNSLFRHKIQIF